MSIGSAGYSSDTRYSSARITLGYVNCLLRYAASYSRRRCEDRVRDIHVFNIVHPRRNSNSMRFEDHGVSLAVIQAFAAAAEAFRLAPRHLLACGGTALGLEPPPSTVRWSLLATAAQQDDAVGVRWKLCFRHGGQQTGSIEPAPEPAGPAQPAADRQVAVQVRELDAGRTLVIRRPGRVPRSAIVKELKAAVGDRVLVPPPPLPAVDADPFEPLTVDTASDGERRCPQAALFQWIDRDGDGVISRAEYGRYHVLLGSSGEQQAEGQWTGTCRQFGGDMQGSWLTPSLRLP